MGYSSQGKRPAEYASKSSHGYIINDPSVLEFLSNCNMPASAEQVDLLKHNVFKLDETIKNPIKNIIAIDGSYTEVPVNKDFPSSTISFFQFGALSFSISDLENLSDKPFIFPEDIAKLKEIERFEFVLPTKNVNFKNEISFIHSVRRTLYDFFVKKRNDDNFIETLRWFVFEEYNKGSNEWFLASCPACEASRISLKKSEMQADYTFSCKYCKGKIYLTDVFRLHEAIDNELGAGGILGYVTTLFEQMILVHLIRIILKTRPALLKEIIFIKDGPLAFFGQTANMHKPMRKLVKYLFKTNNLYLAGLEKSGSFVEHANEISKKLSPCDILILNDEYIYKYIIPGKADPDNPYGRTTYYGNKIIFKSDDDRIYVVTLPTKDVLYDPEKKDFINLDVNLINLKKLKCNMYDSALLPISLVNKLVSLAVHPSSVILEKFAKDKIKK